MTTANTFLLSRDVITSDSQSCRAFARDGNRDGFFAYTSGDDARKSESSLLGLVGGGGGAVAAFYRGNKFDFSFVHTSGGVLTNGSSCFGCCYVF